MDAIFSLSEHGRELEGGASGCVSHSGASLEDFVRIRARKDGTYAHSPVSLRIRVMILDMRTIQ